MGFKIRKGRGWGVERRKGCGGGVDEGVRINSIYIKVWLLPLPPKPFFFPLFFLFFFLISHHLLYLPSYPSFSFPFLVLVLSFFWSFFFASFRGGIWGMNIRGVEGGGGMGNGYKGGLRGDENYNR